MVFRNEKTKQNEMIAQIKAIWEGEHGEEMTEAYNEIIAIFSTLNMYSANILVNLLWLQTVQKTYLNTIGKEEVKING